MQTILVLIIFGLMSCASGRTLEEDRNNPSYHNGDYGAQTPSPYPPGTPQNSDAAGAIAGGLLAIPQIASYYKGNKHLKGNCLIKSENDPLGRPCQMYVMVLTDLSEKEVARTNANELGDFQFIGLKSGKYLMQIIARGKHEPIATRGPFVTGQRAVIILEE